MTEYNAKYRDSLFRDYFKEPVRLLSLCNAVLGTDYTDPDALKINTLEGIFFDKQKNDISCTIENYFLVLVEHQTAVNENMPFRCLSYAVELLNNLITDKNRLYHRALITFPRPRFFVLYNGDKDEPLQRKMRLSTAFGGDSDSLELVVTSFNINHSSQQPLLKKCPFLGDYSALIAKVKEGVKQGLSHRDAIIRAVKFGVNSGWMHGYLEFNSQEVFNMLALEWDFDSAMRANFEDGYTEGRAEGRNIGLLEGRIETKEAIALKMIRKGKLHDEIQELTDLPLERIKQLAANFESERTQ